MNRISVFTKPWKDARLYDLIEVIGDMGFDAIELPVREGFQVEPHNVAESLPVAVKELKAAGITITSIAAKPTEEILRACDQNDIRLVRTMFMPKLTMDYLILEQAYIDELRTLEPLCRKYNVKIGLQMHRGTGLVTTSDMMRVVSQFDSRYIGAIWDAAHSGLAGENPVQALDICWSHLCLVNFKNAKYLTVQGSGPDRKAMQVFYCAGDEGMCPWDQAMAYLKKKGYEGNICMPAEYSDVTVEMLREHLDRDHKYLKELIKGQ